jgi:hypothetical protein
VFATGPAGCRHATAASFTTEPSSQQDSLLFLVLYRTCLLHFRLSLCEGMIRLCISWSCFTKTQRKLEQRAPTAGHAPPAKSNVSGSALHQLHALCCSLGSSGCVWPVPQHLAAIVTSGCGN